jgi:hypothetical protein
LTDIDWWVFDGIRHAFRRQGAPFRSLCGEVRWTARAKRASQDPFCDDCIAASAVATPVRPVPAAPMDPTTKKRVFKRRWAEKHGFTHRQTNERNEGTRTQ